MGGGDRWRTNSLELEPVGQVPNNCNSCHFVTSGGFLDSFWLISRDVISIFIQELDLRHRPPALGLTEKSRLSSLENSSCTRTQGVISDSSKAFL